jgi:anti-sigma B factor antagonist
MNIKTAEENGKVTIKVDGEIDLYNSIDFRKTINSYIDQRKINILIDMDDVDFMDSSAVGTLISTATDIKELGGNLVIKCDSPNVKKIFELTKLDNYFNII